MADGLLGVAVLAVPGRGRAMQAGQLVGRLALELRPQELGEQVVIAIPLLRLVEGGDEEVLSGQAPERHVRVAPAGHDPTEGG